MSENKLWFTAGQIEQIRKYVQQGQPTAKAIAQTAARMAQLEAGQLQPDNRLDAKALEDGGLLTAWSVHVLLTGDQQIAEKAYDLLMHWASPQTANLGRGTRCLIGAICQECCSEVWSAAQAAAVNRRLIELHQSFYTIGHGGDPHVVTNNHWGVSHAGSLVAALAAHGQVAAPGAEPVDLAEGIEWALDRVRAFLGHLGDKGFYHEGIGYGLYPASFWWAAILAARSTGWADLLEEFPNIRNQGASMYGMTSFAPMVDEDGTDLHRTGMRLSWNDDGTGWVQSNVAACMVAGARGEQTGALRWMFDRLNGVDGDGRFGPGWGGLFFSLVCYPYDTEPVEADRVLPKHICDYRQGMMIVRNRYRDADDSVLGLYAKQTFVGGHKHDDAGSLRLLSHGMHWITGGGQARPDAAWQSVFFPADGSRASEPLGKGAILCNHRNATGAVFGCDLRRVNNAYCERWVAVEYGHASGAEVLVAILDVTEDHLGRNWLWNLTCDQRIEAEVHCDGRGVSLTADGGTNGQLRLFGTQPRRIDQTKTPDSQRTFQGGNTVYYPGRPVVQVAYDHAWPLGVLAVLAIGRGAPARIEQTDGLNVTVDGVAWDRPFGSAIPAAYQPGHSGTLSHYPHARPLD